MRLRYLQIKGYRNFSDITIDFEEDCTVIIGENNVGKSNVLDALYASLRVNRTIKQGAFDLDDYHLASQTAMAGDAGPIELTAIFGESVEDEWPEPIVAALRDVPNVDSGGLQSVTLKVTSVAAGENREEDYDWNFLDAGGVPRTKKRIDVLNVIQKLRPLFHLDTMREASREFSKRSTFFGPFVSDPTFDDELRADILASLGDINTKVLGAHEAFSVLSESLAIGTRVVQNTAEDIVRIEAVPTRLSDLLANTHVSFQTPTGAVLPLERHGSGTQSLSVFSLFRAYVAAKLAGQMDTLSEPILSLEEPEAHLHPCAIRTLWPLLTSLQGQKVVTSHSGDLLSEVPLRCIRRLVADKAGNTACHRIDVSAFDVDDIRHINYLIRATRGELFFAKGWILVEGRSESSSLPEFARAINNDLIARGVRVVEYQQCGGPVPFIKLAEQLGIAWHCLADDDQSGRDNVQQVVDHLAGRDHLPFVTVLDSTNFESYMCKHGFLDIVLPHVSPEKAHKITAVAGSDEYFVQVSQALIRRRKERIALEVASVLHENPLRMPGLILQLVRGFLK